MEFVFVFAVLSRFAHDARNLALGLLPALNEVFSIQFVEFTHPPGQLVRRENAATMILDLTNVPYIDSAGLGSLVGAYVSCQKTGRRVVLCGVNQRIMKMFVITKVEPLFLIFPTLWDAIEILTRAGHA